MPGLPMAAGRDRPQYVDPYAEQLAELQRRMEQPPVPAMTPEQAADARWANQRDYQLGLLGQLSGDETFGNVGGQVFKQALAGRQKRVSDQGAYDPLTGEFQYHPEVARSRLEQKHIGLQQTSAAARAKWDEQRQRADEQAAQAARDEALQRALAAQADATRRDIAEANRAGAAERAALMAGLVNGAVKATYEGHDPISGDRIVSDRQGFTYVVDSTGRTQTPYSGPVIPKVTWDKMIGEATTSQIALASADKMLADSAANAEAFGFRGKLMQLTPAMLKDDVAARLGLAPKQVEVASKIMRTAALEINKLYGAALTHIEERRANTFIPNPDDSIQILLAKLKVARDLAEVEMRRFGPGVLAGVDARLKPRSAPGAPNATAPVPGVPGASPGAPGASGDMSPADWAELEALRARFPQRGGGQ